MSKLCLIVPCYNEEEIIEASAFKLNQKMQQLILNKEINPDSKIMFINDGSTDNTWNLLQKLHNDNNIFCAIKLSRNFGHQSAVLAGLMQAHEKIQNLDVTISIDADLQQDIEVIDVFLKKWSQGCEIVYGVRSDRKTDGIFKRISALGFYKIMNLMGCHTIKNHADYRLISNKALEQLAKYQEVNLFLRGLVPTLGYKTDIVYFNVFERVAGKSKYNLGKMLALALDGITSFSVKPMRYISAIGIIAIFISVFQIINLIISYLRGAETIIGWASLICSIWFFGGFTLFALGIIGEYIGKIYLETKHRPRYIIEKVLLEA